MTLWKGLVPRLLALAGLSALVGGLLLLPVTAWLSLELGSDRVGRLLKGILSGPEGARCVADPQGWASTVFPSGMASVYDAGFSAGGAVRPGPDPLLLERLHEGRPVAARLDGTQGGFLLVQVAPAGPCSLIQLHWKAQRFAQLPLALWLLGVTCLAIVLTTGLGVALVVRPLLERIGRLHQVARVIGQPALAWEVKDPTPDALGELSTHMWVAHQRIRSDADTLVQRQQALERHLADVAHDLRTPLTALQLSLEQAWSASDRPELEGSLTRCLEDVVYLGALTENLRLACALQEGVHPQAGAVLTEGGQALDAVCRRLLPLARRRKVALEFSHPEGPVWLLCAPIMLERLLANCIHNAIQYGREGGNVAALLENPEPGRFMLLILDDGPGVPPGAIERLGTRSFRAETGRKVEPRGSGLGLSIVASVCEGCGWSLTFAPGEPQGLCVQIMGQVELEPPAPSSLERA